MKEIIEEKVRNYFKTDTINTLKRIKKSLEEMSKEEIKDIKEELQESLNNVSTDDEEINKLIIEIEKQIKTNEIKTVQLSKKPISWEEYKKLIKKEK